MVRTACVILFSAAALAAGRQPAGVTSRTHPEMLVSTQWLADHLKDPSVVILHVSDGLNDYKRGHIPGARWLEFKKFAVDSGPLGVELPSVEQLRQAFQELGVGDNSRVVIYTTGWYPYATRAYFTLDYLGHGDKAALLDGGIDQWLNEDRPVTGTAPKFSPATFTPHVHENRVSLEDVKNIIDGRPGTEADQIVDARPARGYTAGHLEGATNIYWQDTQVSEEDFRLQSVDKLRALYASRGIVPGKRIVTYCAVGLQASHAYFLAKYLGYDAALYDGSYQEWSAKNMPVVKGESKR
jgi:thiosulfate/3-mercaptopyruvate sulfurtransferase